MKSRLFYLLIIFAFSSCKKDSEQPATATTAPILNLGFGFKVGNSPLSFDTIQYFNQAGNNYSVTSVRFYLSQISLIKSDDTPVLIKDYLYVDAKKPSSLNVILSNLPQGCFKGLSFNIGIDSIHNVENGLPLNSDNFAMEWPSVMGGGYHFLMLEGHFRDSTATPGYAMHLGTNSSLVKVNIIHSICLTENATLTKTLIMDINEWYTNPAIFDFNVDGNYIMGNMMAMQKLAGNGSDVFVVQ